MEDQAGGHEESVRPACCIIIEEEFILWKERQGRLAKGDVREVEQEEETAWEERIAEGECRDIYCKKSRGTLQGKHEPGRHGEGVGRMRSEA